MGGRFQGQFGLRALAFLLACAGVRAGAQAALVADAHVSSAAPDGNSGGLTNLAVGGGYTTLLQFDLGLLPAGTTAAQVSRAVLRVYANRVDVAGVVGVAPVTAAWTEYGVTYTTMPSAGGVVASAGVSGAGQFVSFDVTGTVRGWVAGTTANDGLELAAGSGSGVMAEFDSKENDLTGHAAELEIVLAAGGAGTVGPQGPAGPAGVAGPQGPAGPAGAMGLPGAAGPAGAAGAAGPVGPAGPQGLPGSAGRDGAAGVAGAAGAAGPAGAPGFVYQGAYGSATNYALGDVVVFGGGSWTSLVASNHGNTPGQSPGYWGLLTAQGPMGAQGLMGTQGVAGVQGPPGSVGPPGERGDQGLQGIAGQAGAQGIPGTTGAQGLSGPMGPQGVPGPVGLSFKGAYSAGTNYDIADGVLWQGAGWVSLVASNHGNTPDQSPGYWSEFAAPGATGPVGAVGLTGPAGPQGVTGMQGVMGATGPTGAQGATGLGLTFQGAYASTTNYAANDAVSYAGGAWVSLVASNHGNTPDQSPGYWGLMVPQGMTGAVGAVGPAGAAGAPGAMGAAGTPGAAGPTGAKGDPGLQGPAGAQGLTGPAGAKGDKGDTGAQGPAGQGGAQGLTGTMGAMGAPGAQGAVGPQGPQGVQGQTGAVGPVGLNFRGAWNGQTRYAVNDVVTFGGATYLAQGATMNAQPDADPGDWAVVAAAGGAGPTGGAGAAATVTVGSVTTLAAGAAATVTNTGSATAAVLNFGVPQGASGATGPAGSGGGGGGAAVPNLGGYAGTYHAVSFSTAFYAVNAPTAAAGETAAVLAWVPRGCSAVRLDVFSQQSNNVTVTLRNGTPGAMSATSLSCTTAVGACSVTLGSGVAVAAGSFVDLGIAGASGTAAGVWTAVECD